MACWVIIVSCGIISHGDVDGRSCCFDDASGCCIIVVSVIIICVSSSRREDVDIVGDVAGWCGGLGGCVVIVIGIGSFSVEQNNAISWLQYPSKSMDV